LPLTFEVSYFALPALLAQASLQYFDLALNVVYGFLQTGHFFSIPNPAFDYYMIGYKFKAFL
jgi:hypothetical protein